MIHSPYLLIPPSETAPGVLQGLVGALLLGSTPEGSAAVRLDWSAVLTVAPRGRARARRRPRHRTREGR